MQLKPVVIHFARETKLFGLDSRSDIPPFCGADCRQTSGVIAAVVSMTSSRCRRNHGDSVDSCLTLFPPALLLLLLLRILRLFSSSSMRSSSTLSSSLSSPSSSRCPSTADRKDSLAADDDVSAADVGVTLRQ